MPPSVTRRGRGFSLVEVLVAMLVLAIGLLGLAALQTQGVRFNHDALVRTSATNLASDIMDAMRTARAQDGAGAVEFVTARFPARKPMPADGYSTVNPPYDCDPTPTMDPMDINAADADVAVAQEMADATLPCWLNTVELTLPLGRATITQQAAAPALFDIALMWLDREPREFGNDTRLPQNLVECEALPNRTWRDDLTRCFVTQSWTVAP